MAFHILVFPCLLHPYIYIFTYTYTCMNLYLSSMDSHGFVFDASNFQPVYDDGIIDLGLSLKTLQPQTYHPPGNVCMGGYGELIDWSQLSQNLKNSSCGYSEMVSEDCDDEAEGVQSKERWAYVKVNMDGVIVGRKVCILNHGGYSSLALQLEDMFGRQTVSGLRLFQAGSEFSLFYKDTGENWRTVGDVPWKEFVDCVKRIRIARKNGVLSAFT